LRQAEGVNDDRARDWVLTGHVVGANTYPGLGITLLMPGTVVCGRLIGEREWAAALDRRMTEAWQQRDQTTFNWGDIVQQQVSAFGQDDDSVNPTWIHLRDAQLFAAGIGSVPCGLWRGRLADVSGWSLGVVRAGS
jgi:hypothetical protein